MENETNQNETKRKPKREVRIGRIKAALWENQHDGESYTNITVSRIYKDKQNDWQSSDSFGRDDLLVLSQVALAAYSDLAPTEAKDVQ